MRHIPAVLLSTLLLLASGCQTRQPIHTVDKVDLNRFMGDWYVIASIPTFIEKDAFNAMVGAILIFIGLVFTILGITVIPVIGLLIALGAFVMGAVFLLAPRSRACTLLAQKVRGVAKS